MLKKTKLFNQKSLKIMKAAATSHFLMIKNTTNHKATKMNQCNLRIKLKTLLFNKMNVIVLKHIRNLHVNAFS